MGTKSKRKSISSGQEDAKKKSNKPITRTHISSPLSWSGTALSAAVSEGQALVFSGTGLLTVSTGMVLVQGSMCRPGDQPLQLCADERAGGALLIEPVATKLQVPRAAGSAGVALHIASWRPSPSPTPGAGGEAAQKPSFSVHLSMDPQAPCVLPFGDVWLQVSAALGLPTQVRKNGQDVEHSTAQQAWHSTAMLCSWGTFIVAVDGIVNSLTQLPPSSPPIIVVAGPKKVGKSTFARHLVNTLLNTYAEVAFMDTDCGQTEFTPPGLVSLSMLSHPILGPPHMHLQPPTLSYFMGDLSPACDPLMYLRYVREMYSWYLRRAALPPPAAATGAASFAPPSPHRLPPLVVNTHGWVKGLGLDLLIQLLQSLHPVTHLVQLCAANPHKNLPEGVFWEVPDAAVPAPVLMWRLPALGCATGGAEGGAQPSLSGVSQSSGRAGGWGGGGEGSAAGGGSRARPPVELRALQWTAFARQCVAAMGLSEGGQGVVREAEAGEPGGATSSGGCAEVADMLAAVAPYEVKVEDVEIQVLHSPIPASQTLRALNCAVVGLCTRPSQPPEGGAAGDAPLPPCLGVGLVRGVDSPRGVLYLLTPLQEHALQEVAILQLGKLELPNALLQSSSFLSPYLCLFSISSMGTGAGVIKSRNNLARQSQM